MARILGIDFGTKRVGLAVTDPLKIIVNPLTTLGADGAIEFLRKYLIEEDVEAIVCGDPGVENTDTRAALSKFVEQLKSNFPAIPIVFQDEQFTSHRATRLILESGSPKKARRDKALVDKISAVLILQDYLGHSSDIHTS